MPKSEIVNTSEEFEYIWDEALEGPHANLMADIDPEDDKEHAYAINRKLREQFKKEKL